MYPNLTWLVTNSCMNVARRKTVFIVRFYANPGSRVCLTKTKGNKLSSSYVFKTIQVTIHMYFSLAMSTGLLKSANLNL